MVCLDSHIESVTMKKDLENAYALLIMKQIENYFVLTNRDLCP